MAGGKQLSFFQMWHALMSVFGKTHRFKYQDGKALIRIFENRMVRK